MMAVPQGFHMMAPAPAPPPPEPKGKDDEPPNKRQKTEDQLMPEDEFLRRYKVSYGPTPVPPSPEPKGSLGDIR